MNIEINASDLFTNPSTPIKIYLAVENLLYYEHIMVADRHN